MKKVSAGIVLILVGVAAVAGISSYRGRNKQNREAQAISTLLSFHSAQAQFVDMTGKFGTLKELEMAGLITSPYANGEPVAGYVYTVTNLSKETYCVLANRVDAEAGERDFNIIEDSEVRFIKSKMLGSAVCGKGILLARQ